MGRLGTIIKGLNDFWRAQVWVLEGVETNSQTPCTVLYSGSSVHKNYVGHLVFGDNFKASELGHLNCLKVLKLLKHAKLNYDITLIEGLHLHRTFYKYSSDFFIPLWLNARVSIPLTATNRSTKDDARRIRKYLLDYCIAQTVAEYDTFYHRMYLPTMALRHEDRTIAMSYNTMIDQLDNHKARLLMVMKDNYAIGGTIIRMEQNHPVLWSTGIRDADSIYYKYGITSACYLFCSQYLAELGYTEMDMGLSRAFLSDGVLQFKKKWNGHFKAQGQRGFILKIHTFTEATQAFLKANPFAYISENKLQGAVFGSSDLTEGEKERLELSLALEGIESRNFYGFDTKHSCLRKFK